MEPIAAKVSSRGHIVLPASIRKEMDIKPGGKILISREKNRLILTTVSSYTEKLAGLTKKTIAKTPDDVAAYIDEQRQDRSE